jgi:putative endopeptidase
MDEKAIQAMGTKPLQDELQRIEAIKDRADLLKEIAHLHTLGVNVVFNFGAGQDDKDSTREISQARQGGLGMPDRDYYTKTDDASKKLRDQYVAHVTKMLTLLGEPAATAAEHARKILELETVLAQASRTRVELRDPQKNYNKMPQSELQALTPDWKGLHYLTCANQVQLDKNNHAPAVENSGTMLSYSPFEVYRCCQHNVSHGWPGWPAWTACGGAHNNARIISEGS